MVFQHFNLFPHMTALQNCMEAPVQVLGLGKDEAEARSVELLDMVGLADKKDQHPSRLSGGQQQRVAIARALVTGPSILLADEPTGNLDSATGADIMKLFDKLHAAGNTIIIVTHELDIARHAQRIVRLSDGAVVGDGPSGELL